MDSFIHRYGGSYHKNYFNTDSSLTESRTFKLSCNGNETSITDCQDEPSSLGADRTKTIAVTCMTEPLLGTYSFNVGVLKCSYVRVSIHFFLITAFFLPS